MLKITDLSVSIDQKPIVQVLNLEILPGTIHALMGPNGSGKSTLAYALMGHPGYQVSGSVTFNNESILELSPDKRAKLGIFLSFQHPLEIPGVQVFNFLKQAHQALTGQHLSVAEFTARAQEALALLNLDPSFLYRNLNEGFSGGEKKRLEMLQLLIFKPTLVILDELDSGLDIDALKIVSQALLHTQKENPCMSIIIITHYQRMLEYLIPDHVHILAQGSIAKSGDVSLVSTIEHKGYDGAIAN